MLTSLIHTQVIFAPPNLGYLHFLLLLFSFKLSTYTFPTFAQHMSDDSLVFADINHAKSIQIGLKLYFLYCEE